MMNMTKKSYEKMVVAFLGVALGACSPGGDTTTPIGDPVNQTNPTGPGEISTSGGGGGTTFDHPQIQDVDPFVLLNRMQKDGPPEYQARSHSCSKIKYATLGNILKSRGVNLANATATSAGKIYTAGAGSLGMADYGSRVPESSDLTTSGASKMFDIWTSAANEVVTAMPTLASCKVNGVATNFFDGTGKCTKEGIQCLTGMPASQAAVDLCNQITISASTPALGKTLAVAAIASAAHTCE